MLCPVADKKYYSVWRLMYQKFVDSGLPFDWMTIQVGWQGFGSWGNKLSGEEVVAFALDRVGRGTNEQDRLAALLANEDSRNWQAIEWYLQQLVETEHGERSFSLRKWRLAEFMYVLLGLKLTTGDDEWDHFFFVFTSIWRHYEELPDSCIEMSLCNNTTAGEMLRYHQAWAEKEMAELQAILNG